MEDSIPHTSASHGTANPSSRSLVNARQGNGNSGFGLNEKLRQSIETPDNPSLSMMERKRTYILQHSKKASSVISTMDDAPFFHLSISFLTLAGSTVSSSGFKLSIGRNS